VLTGARRNGHLDRMIALAEACMTDTTREAGSIRTGSARTATDAKNQVSALTRSVARQMNPGLRQDQF